MNVSQPGGVAPTAPASKSSSNRISAPGSTVPVLLGTGSVVVLGAGAVPPIEPESLLDGIGAVPPAPIGSVLEGVGSVVPVASVEVPGALLVAESEPVGLVVVTLGSGAVCDGVGTALGPPVVGVALAVGLLTGALVVTAGGELAAGAELLIVPVAVRAA